MLGGLGTPGVALADPADPAVGSAPALPSPAELRDELRRFEDDKQRELCGNGPSIGQLNEQAVQKLAGFGPPILPLLKPYLSSEDRSVSRYVFHIFARVGGDLAREELLAASRSPRADLRTNALLTLPDMRLAPEQSRELFANAVKDSDKMIRLQALLRLRKISPAQHGQTGLQRLEQMKPLLRSQDATDRVGAVSVIAKLAPEVPEAIPVLISALKSPDQGVRMEAVTAVALWGPLAQAAVKPLSALTRDKHPRLQVQAIEALAAIDEAAARRFLPVLRRHVENPPSHYDTAAPASALLQRLSASKDAAPKPGAGKR